MLETAKVKMIDSVPCSFAASAASAAAARRWASVAADQLCGEAPHGGLPIKLEFHGCKW